MRKLIFSACMMLAAYTSFPQISLTQLPSGGNKKAIVGEQVGLTTITISYSRPGVKHREGHIWGQLIHKGFIDQGFGSSKSSPWRAGANENTTIEFSNDVTIEGQTLKAGKYGFFIAYDSLQSTVIFSKNSNAWGSYFYQPEEDALRVKVAPVKTSVTAEWLKYEFMNQTESSATIALVWENLMIPFKVETDYAKQQVASFEKELQGSRGFYWVAWDEAAQWALQRNTNLERALYWSETATGPNFGGRDLFQPNATRAQILEKLNRGEEARAVMNRVLPTATMQELHQYGRNLLAQNKAQEALEVFQLNFKKNPKEFTAMMGLTRGYSAAKDFKNAVKYANMALAVAPNEANKKFLEQGIEKLKKGENIN